MSLLKTDFEDGIIFNVDHGGLLSLDEEQLIHIIKNEPITNVYHVEQTPFARGKFAAVRKCTHQQTGKEYAAKFIRKRRRAMDQRKDIIHEVAVLRLAAENQRIVKLHEVYETTSEMALVLELASGGELQCVLDIQDGLQEKKAVEVMRQILEGLSFLHEKNIAHLDLKPQNLLLTGAYPECDIKLCDFGISRVIQKGIEVREILGTPDYVAPEILSYEPITLATDIWSVGVLAYVILSGFSPFAGDNKQETFLNISQCSLTFPDELFQEVSTVAKDFIRATLQVEPLKRLTAKQCLVHPWLSKGTESVDSMIMSPSDQHNGITLDMNHLLDEADCFKRHVKNCTNGIVVEVPSVDPTSHKACTVLNATKNGVMLIDISLAQSEKAMQNKNDMNGITPDIDHMMVSPISHNGMLSPEIDSPKQVGTICIPDEVPQKCIIDHIMNDVVLTGMVQDVVIGHMNVSPILLSETETIASTLHNGVWVDMSHVVSTEELNREAKKPENRETSNHDGTHLRNGLDRVNNLVEDVQCCKVVADYKERRMAQERRMSQVDEERPLNKRPKNCDCCVVVSQCCHANGPQVMC